MASTQTALVRLPAASAAPIRRRRSSRPARRKGHGPSPTTIRTKHTTKTLALGGLSSLAFGLLQKNLDLPSIANVPDTLLYGAIGVVGGVLLKSDTMIQCASGPFFAGLHRVGTSGFNVQAGDTLSGEFDEVVSGDFDDV